MKHLLLFFIIAFTFQTEAVANRFEFTPPVREVYDKVLSLKFSEAEQLIHQIKKDDPENLMIYLVENYIDFFTVFINEEKSQFKQLERNKDHRLKMIRQGDRNSPYFLYTQAEIKLQWALVRLKFEEYFTAFTEVSSAYKMLTRNQKKFPDFVANKKSLGVLHALVGTVPDSYKWSVKLLGGMGGTIEQGKREIEEILKYAQTHRFIFEEETLVMYAFLMLHLKNDLDEAWNIVHNQKLNPQESPLACFALANVAMRTGRNDDAIRILENRPEGAQYAAFPYLDYMLGLTKLYRLDEDAHLHLKKFIKNYNGQNYLKEAYQKLAWHYLIHGSKNRYETYIGFCKTHGAAIIGGDKNALQEAKSGQLPNQILLKARLLFDGGYYKRTYTFLKNECIDEFTIPGDRLEYTYRLGRVTHQLKKLDEAISFYQKTIDEGRYASYYFACNAALQMGLVYEKKQNIYKAKEYFKLCLNIHPQDYKNSLHQKAKAGLNRLKK